MRKTYLFIVIAKVMLLTVASLLLSLSLSAQQVITEYYSGMPDKNYQWDFEEQGYSKLFDEDGRKVFMQKQDAPKQAAAEVSLFVNFDFDAEQYGLSMITVYNESGYRAYSFFPEESVVFELEEGNYDVMAVFDNKETGQNHFVIEEQVNVQAKAAVSFDVAEAINYVSVKAYDENGNSLEPGIVYPGEESPSSLRIVRTIMFQPSNAFVNGMGYNWDGPIGDEEPKWNFYINNVSDRYAVLLTLTGMRFKDDSYYFLKYKTLNDGIAGSLTWENRAEDWVSHTEYFQSSPLGISSENAFPGIAVNNTYKGMSVGAFGSVRTYGNMENGLRIYLSNSSTADDPADFLVYPAIRDYYQGEPILIDGNAIVLDENNEVMYGSGNSSRSEKFYDIGNYNYKVMPFHPKFTFTAADNPGIVQGDNAPISVIGKNYFKYKGRYGEFRGSDVFATEVEVKQDDDIIFSGNYMADGFKNFTLPATGKLEITYTNTNIEVNGIAGKNITKQYIDKANADTEAPTLQHLQFRAANNKVTDRFASVSQASVRLAAGDFQFNPTDEWGSGYFIYNTESYVEFYYSVHDQDSWAAIPLTHYPEYFQMPAFGDYYEASLASIGNTETNTWYDVKIICTDAAGNIQEQIVSPAFRIDGTVGINDIAESTISCYPNPVEDVLSITSNEPVASVSVYNIAGQKVLNIAKPKDGKVNMSQYAPGTYIVTAVLENGKTERLKVIKK